MTTDDHHDSAPAEQPQCRLPGDAHEAAGDLRPNDSIAPGVPPTEQPEDIYVARPVWSDKDRFLLRDASRSSVWADMALLIAGLVAFEVLFGIVVVAVMGTAALGITPDGSDIAGMSDEATTVLNHTLLVPLLMVRAAFSAGLIWLLLRWRRQRAVSVGVSRDRWRSDLLVGIGATPVVYGLIMLSSATIWLIKPSLLEQMAENADLLTDLLPKMSIASFFGLAAAVGVYEELIFRGFLITRLRRGTGSWMVAVVMSTAVFTGLHAFDQTPVALISVAILGLSFSLMTIWRRSILPAIVTHALFDFSQFLWLVHTRGDTWT